MIRRIISTFFVLLAVVLLPYWIYLPFLFILFIVFSFYWEGVVIGFVIDVLYGAGQNTGIFSYPFALGAVILVIVLLPLRAKLRFHA